MIVYSKDKMRYQNYLDIKKINDLKYFEAVDTISDNNWNKWSKEAIINNYTSSVYLNEINNLRGKLGCNLSHQKLLNYILKMKTLIGY